MILQSLVDLYDRWQKEGAEGLAPPGLERVEIPFVIVLDKSGRFIDLEDMRDSDAKGKPGRAFLVPQGVKRSSGIKANLLWDNPGYTFGLDQKGNAKRAQEQRVAFIQRIEDLPDTVKTSNGIKQVLSFLQTADYSVVKAHPLWTELEGSTGNVSFRLEGASELVCQLPILRDFLCSAFDTGKEDGICLVTGNRDEIEELHTAVKGVWGAQTAGANIVSFNLRAFTSYGKEKGKNAPVGKRAMFAYTTALNILLGKGSKHRMQVGDASTVFWAEKSKHFESLFFDLFGEVAKDDPGKRIAAVKSLFASPHTGTFSLDDDNTKFYVLGLAPNAARISIRFWYINTVRELATSFRHYFRDVELTGAREEIKYPSIFRMLTAAATENKADKIISNVAGDFMLSILNGRPFPQTILAAAIRRIRSGDAISHTLMSLIKGYLARLDRINNREVISVALDTSNTNIAYRLGRLFAVLERAQEEANPGVKLNSTIRERYYSAASATPVAVFALLLRLKNHHIAKIQKEGKARYLEKLIGEIMDGLKDFPAHLPLPEQGRFAVGYYHQRQHFFTKHEKDDHQGDE